ncbi:lysophospholipid acyltransferase family protein [Roseomonas sp. E05]|uniref:lysophospholipid acyltransferase family protein n=1 Tax=Roseomonas sp. E05 TaxID=3046310 RepID=UPI0024BAB04B|nr:lysophospholipid acyltransferase family protein [Roseomonas sp. E05]MDJ0389527.1 lysophospholipid acyltransferase family protein [Roseomonas sp. E05]
MFYGLLLLFAVMCLLWSLPAALLHRLLPASAGRPLGQWGISRGFRLFLGAMRLTGVLRCDLSALDALRGERGLIITPNHPSMLDAVLVTSRLPRVVCITKASLWDNPLLGGGVRLAGYVRNDATQRMIRDAAAALQEGRQLLIFPEATRSPPGAGEDAGLVTPAPGPFSRSFAVIARRAGAPVQTVVIESETPYLRKGWPVLRRPPLPLRCRVRLGPRFLPDGRAEELCGAVECCLRQSLPGARRQDMA